MPEVIVLQHHPKEPLGTLADALAAAGLTPRCVQVYAGDPVPKTIGTAHGLIVLGGPQSVYEQDRFPYLADELRLIEDTLRQDKPILGLCLGSQLLATALGAPVGSNVAPEIGWYPIARSEAALPDPLWSGLPPLFTGFHWHGDIFQLPSGAVNLASSALTPCQAFRHGAHAWGLQFHLEVTEPILQDWSIAYAEDLHNAGLTDAAILTEVAAFLPPMQPLASGVFGRWATIVCSRV